MAYASYQGSVQQSRRSLGTQALLETGQRLERCATANLSYEAANCAVTLPFDAPVSGTNRYYTISISDRSATTYTLTATAINAQADDTACASMSLTNLGAKTPANCW
ncbi:MAG: type IV pilin protein [Candidatus Polarisedimenticolaceae bacterium]|nr:type IV pilin protein [Candidatus Polarisedimenticolaceae bacterium]